MVVWNKSCMRDGIGTQGDETGQGSVGVFVEEHDADFFWLVCF